MLPSVLDNDLGATCHPPRPVCPPGHRGKRALPRTDDVERAVVLYVDPPSASAAEAAAPQTMSTSPSRPKATPLLARHPDRRPIPQVPNRTMDRQTSGRDFARSCRSRPARATDPEGPDELLKCLLFPPCSRVLLLPSICPGQKGLRGSVCETVGIADVGSNRAQSSSAWASGPSTTTASRTPVPRITSTALAFSIPLATPITIGMDRS
jgi:hypothetical protein